MMRNALHGSIVAGALLAIAVLAGCGGGSAGSIPAPVAAMQARGAVDSSWMSAEARSADLLYVADLNKNAVLVFTYPAGKLVGTLKGFSAPHGECTDTAGHVFVADSNGQTIVEYAHGSTQRVEVLNDANANPMHCAFDPKTGNLVVINWPLGSGAGKIVRYTHAKGTATELPQSPVGLPYFAAYDSAGNLWVDGMNSGGNYFQFAELPAGRERWRPIDLPHPFAFPAGVQWVGNELVVGDQVNLMGPSAVYEFSVKKDGTAKLLGTTALKNSCDMLQFAIAGSNLITGGTCKPAVLYFNFPAGGKSTKEITSGVSEPIGIAISPKR